VSAAEVRLAGPADAPRLAELHARRIGEGFLSSLGVGFLTRLYRRIAKAPDSFAYVELERPGGAVVGFAAATESTGALYKSFALHDGVVAGAMAAPQLLRSWRRVLETLRYPGRDGEDLPAAEILAVAVDAAAGGRGVGSRLVEAATARLAARGVTEVKVVTGSDNVAALKLYERCGFVPRARIEVHEGTSSEVLVWSSSSRSA
jgi:ribosomal protein S18 acetylase RimI-like enzyme